MANRSLKRVSKRVSKRGSKKRHNPLGSSLKHKTSHKKRVSITRQFCNLVLREKIRMNMRELEKGRWSSPAQAVAVSYSQVRKLFPKCFKKPKNQK